jgi:hypothetical protein
MLRELLRLVEAAEGPIRLSDLSRQLDVDAAVLDAMLQHWVRKGRLIVEGRAVAQGCKGGCGSCSGMVNCPFVARLPITYRLNLDE